MNLKYHNTNVVNNISTIETVGLIAIATDIGKDIGTAVMSRIAVTEDSNFGNFSKRSVTFRFYYLKP